MPSYSANPDVSCREESDGGALLFNPDNAQSILINSTGLLIWRYLEKSPGATVDEIAAHLLDVCEDVTEEEVSDDICVFIQSLKTEDFVQEA